MPPRRFLSRFAAVFVIAIAISRGPAAAAGPWRNLGPEGHASFVGELRFLAGEDSRHLLARSSHDLWESRDGGASWRSLLAHAPFGGQLGRLAIDPFDRAHWLLPAAGVAPGSGLWQKVSSEPVGILHEYWPDATRPDTAFARYQARLFRSSDGGRTFSPLLSAGGDAATFRQSPVDPSQLAFLSASGLYLSLDRGSSWTSEILEGSATPAGLAFDPANGELLFPDGGALVRRHADGRRDATRPRGLFAAALADVLVDGPRGQTFAVGFDGAFFRRDAGGHWQAMGPTGCRNPQRIAVTPWDPERIYLTCGTQQYLVSGDGGANWVSSDFAGTDRLPNRVVFTPGDPGRTFLLAPELALTPLGAPLEAFPGVVDVAVHPDPSRGLLALGSLFDLQGALYEWTPAAGWQDLGFEFGSFEQRFLAQDPQAPDHLLAVGEYGSSAVSFYRGRTWEERGATQPQVQPSTRGIRALIDPADPRHLIFSGTADLETFESTDGAATWQEIRTGRNNFAYFNQGGQAAPANANSGLFWFFSPNNWEVLVKVLDGCAINGHYWVLAAATTDVGYELRVAEPARRREQVYSNPVGQPSPARIELEAFSCGG